MNYATTTGMADPLTPAAADQRFEALDWFEQDPNEDRCTSHVLLYGGYDLSAAGIWSLDIAPCLLCAPLQADRDPALVVTDETLSWGRHVHFVCCGNCGTRGPWADRESDALQLWNRAHRLHALNEGKPAALDAGNRERASK